MFSETKEFILDAGVLTVHTEKALRHFSNFHGETFWIREKVLRVI